MDRFFRPDPYGTFKDDKERGRTLRSRHRWQYGARTLGVVSLAASSGALPFKEVMTWFSKLPL
jgi:hypothetical protein